MAATIGTFPPPMNDPHLNSQSITLEYRHQAIRRIAITASLLLTPFILENLWRGQTLLALAVATLLVVIIRNGRAVSAGKVSPHATLVAAFLIIATQAWGVLVNGKLAAYWLCPGIIFFFISQGRRRATICSLLSILAVIPLVFSQLGAPIALRMLFPALMIICQIQVFLSMIDKLHARLTEQALTDPLTGAYNRRYMQTSLAEAVERFKRYGTVSSLAVVDLDHFKRVNDELGHDAPY